MWHDTKLLEECLQHSTRADARTAVFLSLLQAEEEKQQLHSELAQFNRFGQKLAAVCQQLAEHSTPFDVMLCETVVCLNMLEVTTQLDAGFHEGVAQLLLEALCHYLQSCGEDPQLIAQNTYFRDRMGDTALRTLIQRCAPVAELDYAAHSQTGCNNTRQHIRSKEVVFSLAFDSEATQQQSAAAGTTYNGAIAHQKQLAPLAAKPSVAEKPIENAVENAIERAGERAEVEMVEIPTKNAADHCSVFQAVIPVRRKVAFNAVLLAAACTLRSMCAGSSTELDEDATHVSTADAAEVEFTTACTDEHLFENAQLSLSSKTSAAKEFAHVLAKQLNSRCNRVSMALLLASIFILCHSLRSPFCSVQYFGFD